MLKPKLGGHGSALFCQCLDSGNLKLTQADGQPYRKLESRQSTDAWISWASPQWSMYLRVLQWKWMLNCIQSKNQSELKDLADGLNQTVMVGLWPMPLLFLGLQFFHNLVGNWGWSIILLTILVKLILWPLSSKKLSFDGENACD